MAMNWTGGTRNRAIKSSTTSRLQKRYFSKVRTAAQTFAIPSSQGNLPTVFKRKERTTPEFDIIVKKARTDHGESVRRGASPLLQVNNNTGKRGGKEIQEDIRKARRRMLLEREDWVCTTLSKPLVLKSKEEMRKLKANPHREATDTSSSGSTSSQEEEEDDDDDSSSTLQNNDKQGAMSAVRGNRRAATHGDTPELPAYPENNEDIYIRIGGSTQKSTTSATNPTSSTEPASGSAEINPTAIRGSSADTMLLDFDKHEPMFQFQHITPALSDIIERKRREGRKIGYSSSPLAQYSRRRSNRVPKPLDAGPCEVDEDDCLIKEVEQASSPIPSSGSIYSTIRLRSGPNVHGKEHLYPEAKATITYDLPRITNMENPMQKEIHKEEVLGNTHMTSAMFRSSQISWSTSPAESRPYEYQGEQSFKETSSETISSENLLNYGPLMGSRNGTQTQVEVISDIERSIHETDGEDEEGGYDGSLRTGSPDNAGTKEPGESEGEEYETDTDQDGHSPGDDQTSTDQISQDSNEGSAKDTQESTDYESDEEDTSTTDEDTEEILDAIHVASALPREDTPAEAIESPINPTFPAQQPIPTQDNLERTKHGQPEHNLAEYNTQDSLGSAVDDQELFTHNEWLDKILATSSELFTPSPIRTLGHAGCANQKTPAATDQHLEPEPELKQTPTPIHRKPKRPAQRFIIPPCGVEPDKQQIVLPSRPRETNQQQKKIHHPEAENLTSPIASPVQLVYSRPHRAGGRLQGQPVVSGDACSVAGGGGGGVVDDIEDF